MTKIVVIGAGAAGLMAAGTAASMGADVILLEKNKVLGRKILITGKGRCNITNAAEDPKELIKAFPGNGSFLFSSFHGFNNYDTVDFFHRYGVETKVERGNRVFPVSDKAEDVVTALKSFALEFGVKIKLEEEVKEIVVEDGTVQAVITKSGSRYECQKVIIATGGVSYPGTGSTGDGYKWARNLGHTIIPVKPALVPIEIKEAWVKELQGLALRNVRVQVVVNNKAVEEDFGEMLFTHFGVSGPIILSLSRAVGTALDKGEKPLIKINLKPALTPEQLDQRLQRDFQKMVRKQFKNSLGELFPKSLIPVVINLSGIDPEKHVHQITREERLALVELIQGMSLTATGLRSIKEAIITAGGINVKEINPKTMESKLVTGLFFAGEVIDVDGYTGGFNLQAAWSTGVAAAKGAAAY